jgi:hypothetical protein
MGTNKDWWTHIKGTSHSQGNWTTIGETQPCWLHHPHGSSLPGKTSRGAICSRTILIYQMDAFPITRPGTLKAILEHGARQHQYESANIYAAVTHWTLGCQQTWDRQFLSNHWHCLVMENVVESTMTSHLECTGVPGWVLVHSGGHYFWHCPMARDLAPSRKQTACQQLDGSKNQTLEMYIHYIWQLWEWQQQ